MAWSRKIENKSAFYGRRASLSRGSPKLFWEAACDVVACTVTVREGEVGTHPEAVVEHFESPEATVWAYGARTCAAHDADFMSLDEHRDAFLSSLDPAPVNPALVRRIEEAFAHVPKGKIGIREASAIDYRMYPGGSYEDAEGYAAAQEADRQESDWRELADEVLAYDPSVFSYFDDQGFKFVLPAVMRWSLSIAFDITLDPWGVAASLSYKLLAGLDDPNRRVAALVERWTLSPAQIAAVVGWLEEFLRASARPLDEARSRHLDDWRALAHPTDPGH